MKFTPKSRVAAAIIGASMILAACGSDETTDTASSTAASSGTTASSDSDAATPGSTGGTAAPNASCTDTPISIGIIPKLGDDPYMTTVRDGMEKAAADAGYGDEITYTSPSEATGSAQIPFVQQLISAKVDVIAISGSDLNSAAAELKKARDEGIKIVSFDSDVAPDARDLFINQADVSELGELMLKSMSDLLGGKGDFAILSSTQTAVNQNAWIADMKEQLTSVPEYAGLKLVDVVYGEEKADVSANRAKELVTTYPDLKGIIVPAGISLPAAATALEESGDLGKVKLTGLAPASLIKDQIAGGNVQDIWWNVSDLGELTYYAARELSSCGLASTEGTGFNAGGLGSFTVGANGEVLLGKATVVTTANIDEFPF